MTRITIRGRRAVLTESELLTAGSAGPEVSFAFDRDWKGLSRTAVFRGSGEAADLLLTDDGPVRIPPEVMAKAGARVEVGVYGTNASGTVVIPTIWCRIGQARGGTEPSGNGVAEITPSLAQQVLAAASAAAEQTAELLERADSGEFIGPQGPRGETGPQGEQGPSGGVSSVNGQTGDVSLSIPATYAGSPAAGGVANKAAAIPFGTVDAGSTSTAISATVDGITELRDGVCAYIRNGVVSSASGWTLNVNGLGAKPVCQTMAAASLVTTAFNVNYTMLFVYNSTRVSGGCWDMFYGYNTNTTYSNASLGQGYAICETAEIIAAKKATLSSYALTAGGYVAVKFTNSVPANATLSVNAKTEKPIYYKGAAITADVILAGDLAVLLYNGSQYHLVAIDRNMDEIADLKKRVTELEAVIARLTI